jgi:hypothetical protein
MIMKTLLASAGSKKNLQKMINEFYFSDNWIIDEENKIFNTKLNKFASGVKVEKKGKRWRFVMI